MPDRNHRRFYWLIPCALAIAAGLAAPSEAAPPPRKSPASRPVRPLQRLVDGVPDHVKAQRDIEYARIGDTSLLLDLFLPQTEGPPRPVVVWVHGGGWRAGSKDRCPAIPLSGQGYVVASINYRLTDVATFPAQIEDCKAAIRWLRAHAEKYNLDAGRIGVWGGSAGGHLVALLGTSGDVKALEGKGGNNGSSSRVQAVCDWYGPTDLIKLDRDAREALQRSGNGNAVTRLIGGPVDQNEKKARQANPITYVSKDDPPFLIMHGDKDPLVPLDQSEMLNDALKKAHVDVTLFVVQGGGHGAGFQEPHILKMVRDFFDKQLKQRAGAASK